jgi:hypothetical protein
VEILSQIVNGSEFIDATAYAQGLRSGFNEKIVAL